MCNPRPHSTSNSHILLRQENTTMKIHRRHSFFTLSLQKAFEKAYTACGNSILKRVRKMWSSKHIVWIIWVNWFASSKLFNLYHFGWVTPSREASSWPCPNLAQPSRVIIKQNQTTTSPLITSPLILFWAQDLIHYRPHILAGIDKKIAAIDSTYLSEQTIGQSFLIINLFKRKDVTFFLLLDKQFKKMLSFTTKALQQLAWKRLDVIRTQKLQQPTRVTQLWLLHRRVNDSNHQETSSQAAMQTENQRSRPGKCKDISDPQRSILWTCHHPPWSVKS